MIVTTGLKDDEWNELVTRISEDEVIPLVLPILLYQS